tara:strand:+ start:39 stop:371 length:333 start_codon:yes stop_codon:yes gene_type:complete
MRYDEREIINNGNTNYNKLFEKRKLKFIRHYRAGVLKYPTSAQIADIVTATHIWSVGSKYYKLADHFYNDPELWWVIAWFNKAPTESHLTIGDYVEIPVSLDQILRIYGF